MVFKSNSNQEMIGRERLLGVSFFRIMSMLMIVIYHCMCYNAGIWQGYSCSEPNEYVNRFASWVVSMALPFFFFISGYIYIYNKKRYLNWKVFIINKFKRLILPCVSWTFICLALFPFHFSAAELVSGVCHLWFLPTLFCIFILVRLITPFLLQERSFIVDVILTVVLIILSYFACRQLPALLLGNIFKYISFFISGIILFKHRFSLNNQYIEFCIVVVLLVLHVLLINIDLFRGQGLLDILVLIITSYLLLDLLSYIKICTKSLLMRLLNNLDSNSMGIYLVHQVLIMFLYQYTMFEESWLTYHPYLGPFVLFLVIFPLSWVFAEAKRRLKTEPYL